jgi:hypothetical protein
MASVFIIYSSRDKSIATKIARDLDRHGVRVWLDTYELLPGDSLAEKITQGVQTSDYLLVILSENSVRSPWVQRETGIAYQRNREASAQRVIPVLIDDSEVPSDLAGTVYVDLRAGYEEGLARIVAAVTSRPAESVPKLSELVDTPDLVAHIEGEQKAFRGAGYLVTRILSVATLLVAAIAAIPSFYSTFGQQPRVYYSVAEQRIALPSDVDAARVTKLLEENGIPDATASLRIVNQGGAVAKEIKAGVVAPGPIIRTSTEPPAQPKPVWVDISIDHDAKQAPRHVTYQFRDLVAGKVVEAHLGYRAAASAGALSVDVVADGVAASEVENLSTVPVWAPWRAFELPLKILGWGFAITLAVGLLAVLVANPASRDALLLLVKELNPTLARLVDALAKAVRP